MICWVVQLGCTIAHLLSGTMMGKHYYTIYARVVIIVNKLGMQLLCLLLCIASIVAVLMVLRKWCIC